MSSVTRKRDSWPRGAASVQVPVCQCEDEGGSMVCCSGRRHTVLHEADIMHHFKGREAEYSKLFDVHAQCVEEARVVACCEVMRALTVADAAWA